MTNRALLLSTFGPFTLALFASACAGGPGSGGSPGGSSSGSHGGGADDSGSSLDAASLGDGNSSGSSSGGGAVGGGGSGSGSSGAAGSSASSSSSSGGQGGDSSTTGAGDAALAGWTLTWSDEFNGADGSAVDASKWKHDVGGTGWGNNELEYYTDGTQNAVQQGGNLVITATDQNASQYHCSYGTCKYTSARLLTQGLFSQQYGRFEARAQMPTGKGLWPAIWALGDNISTVSWPACGEIDFMETIGTDIATNHGSLHMPASYGPSGTYKLPGGANFSQAFHTFAIEWEPGTIRFYVDDNLYETQNRTSVPSGDTWEFEHPFFLLINVAVGGQWPGSPDSTTVFPQTLKVDYVRVYQKNGTEP